MSKLPTCESCGREHEPATPPYCTNEREKVTGRLSALLTDKERLRQALEHIKSHQLIVGGDIAKRGAVYRIAADALEATQ